MSGLEAAAAAVTQVENTYTSIARLLGADPDEVALVENATRAWDLALYRLTFRPGAPSPTYAADSAERQVR
jgi:selenocysteine lyase/cysteine desulfurase